MTTYKPEKQTVYLVWFGEYSDKYVDAVYDNRSQAEIRASHRDGFYEGYIEEMVVNEDPAVPRYRYDITFHPETNELLNIDNVGKFKTEQPRVRRQWYRYTVKTELFGAKGEFTGDVYAYKATVYAEDEGRALRKAQDDVAKFKAEEAGL